METKLDDLILSVTSQNRCFRISGWTGIRITRGIERCPSDFDIEMTDVYPSEIATVSVQPGDQCQVYLGESLVVTGYIDRWITKSRGSQHSVRVTGRGLCQDLVDCSAEWPTGQISGASAAEVATVLASPYGIRVTSDVTDQRAIPQFNLNFGEPAFEVIERVARYSQLLAYENEWGDLMLTRAGTTAHASGFELGVNIQGIDVEFSMDQRYSEYLSYIQSTETLSDIKTSASIYYLPDPSMPRHRRRSIIAEASFGGVEVAKARVQWEMNRRLARSSVINLETDSWRDSAGVVWTPNQLVNVKAPLHKIKDATWLIGEVTYKLDEKGTKAHLMIMPPDAFKPEPTALQYAFVDGNNLPQSGQKQ